jgi:signal transduction histidine kinase/ligand-binding sensor domain-containing protein/AraC-like DNA-binding protein
MHYKFYFFILFCAINSFVSSAQIQPVKFLNGMTTNTITAIAQDSYGFLWLGTDDGLGRFDGYVMELQFPYEEALSSEDITVLFNDLQGNMLVGTRYGAYFHNFNSNTLETLCPIDMRTYIYCFSEDTYGNLWVGTDLGIYIFNPEHILVRRLSNSKGLSGNKVNDIRFVNENMAIVGTEKGMDAINLNYSGIESSVDNVSIEIVPLISNGNVRKIFIDKNRRLWVCVNEEIQSKKCSELLENNPFEKMVSNTEAVCVSQVGSELWFGSRGQGIVRFQLSGNADPNQLKTWWIDETNKSEIKNTILSIRADNYNNVWIGSLDGFYVFPVERKSSFLNLKNNPLNPNSPSHNTISSLVTDKNNTVWMATANGLNKFDWIDKKSKSFRITRFSDISKSDNLIRDNKIQNIIEYKPDVFLLSTKSTLRFFDKNTGQFYSLPKLDEQLTQFNMRYVLSSCKDSFSNTWLTFMVGGIGVIDAKTDRLYTIQSPELHDSRFRSIICDSNNTIWCTSDEQGLFRLQVAENRFEIKNLQNYPLVLFGNAYPTSLKEDSKGNIWIGTSQGIYIFDRLENSITPLQPDNIRRDFYVKGFIEDIYGNIWVSSIKGVYKIAKSKVEYYEPIPQVFMSKVQYIFGEATTHDGYIFLGGVSGLIVFNPNEISPDAFDLTPGISRFSILGKPLSVDAKNISQDINLAKKIVLTHKDFQFSIDFSSLQLLDAQTSKYAYRLLGFDSTWIYTDAQRRAASYSNLAPGNYIFQLKATNNSGVWMKSERHLHVKVLPAPWKTWWAYTLYLLLISAIVLILLRAIIFYNVMKHKEEMTQWKIRYYHNILNTIKTPLSLLQAPLNNLIDNFDTLSGDKIREGLYIIQANTKRLSHFVRQLVEFRKIDLGKTNLKLAEINIVQFSQSVFEAFQPLAQTKGLNFDFTTTVDSKMVIVDVEKIEMVLFNLLSNAIKFTEPGGTVKLNCNWEAKDEKFWIALSDNGIGVGKENHQRIFERFWTAELSESNTQLRGNGIGLSLVKDFVELHESQIFVQSAIGEGSIFKFFIRTDQKYMDKLRAIHTIPQLEVVPLYSEQHIGIEKQALNISKKKSVRLPLVYCIDSDSDLLQYLKNELDDLCCVEIFSTIPDAKSAVVRKQPDLIISEAMFVNSMIGLDFCKQLKENNYTNHISVIILSGLGTEEDKLRAYESGADAFVLKPFDVSYLKVRIQSLLKMRSKVREKMKNDLIVNPKEVEVSTDTDLFLANAMNFIEESIAKEEFDVDQLAESLNVTRSMLYRRFRTLLNQSPADYIKQYRLKRAAQLLETTTYNVTEVAQKVGFNDARHFSKLFKEQYGVLPKSYSLGKKRKQ